ncbi:hypothetical protein F5J12DRAFT_859987 [Pisolithus orientalis]|uniref:uncharacterized protein n=1 Tax=Pisolithus orientalis TaxID=936130 RepID=UPI002223FD05|nr:uncharacterized protein F5J12DRAFT_859987 [Pisolithus orientalis]KAI5992369.1 hypothetical protein F5J12DRAFT_859987 [Pisolithus orientalis]
MAHLRTRCSCIERQVARVALRITYQGRFCGVLHVPFYYVITLDLHASSLSDVSVDCRFMGKLDCFSPCRPAPSDIKQYKVDPSQDTVMPTLIHHLFLRLLTSLGMASQFRTPVDGLFEDQMSHFTTSWWERVIRGDDNAARCYVEKVCWHKQSSTVQHEFLQFDILSMDGRYKSTVVAERGKDRTNSDRTREFATRSPPTDTTVTANPPTFADPTATENFPAVVIPASPANVTPSADSTAPGHNGNILSSLGSSKPSIEADDAVYSAAFGSPGAIKLAVKCTAAICLRTLTFPKGSVRPSAHELSTLLAVTSNHILVYNLMESQCYWFSETVFKALKRLFPLAREDIQSDRAGRWRGVAIPTAESVETEAERKRRTGQQIVEERDQALAERDATAEALAARDRAMAEALAERDRAMAERDRALAQAAERDRAMAERDRALAQAAEQSRAMAEALAKQAQLEEQLSRMREGAAGIRQ